MKADRQRLEAFEMWIWRRIKKISWMDKISDEEVLAHINETRTMLKLQCIWFQKHRWIRHVLWYDELLCNVMEGRMVGTYERQEKVTNVRRSL